MTANVRPGVRLSFASLVQGAVNVGAAAAFGVPGVVNHQFGEVALPAVIGAASAALACLTLAVAFFRMGRTGAGPVDVVLARLVGAILLLGFGSILVAAYWGFGSHSKLHVFGPMFALIGIMLQMQPVIYFWLYRRLEARDPQPGL